MPLQETSGNVTTDAYGGYAAAVPNYIEDVFSTYLYTGNGSSVSITNGINLSTYGGMSWIKDRTLGTQAHRIGDTVRGGSKYLASNTTGGNGTDTQFITAFSTNGLTVGAGSEWNNSGDNFVSWTFRKQPKFFDVVTWTGNNTSQNIAHSLGSVPGCIITKATNAAGDWYVYHNKLNGGTTPEQYWLYLNGTNATSGPNTNIWGNTPPTSTQFSVGASPLTNQSGTTYVAYLFAHNAGGFGLTGTDNVISCGSYTGNGVLAGPNINLGYEPQFVMIKAASTTSAWYISDNMRGLQDWATGVNPNLQANSSAAESQALSIQLNATGFQPYDAAVVNGSGQTYIYIAIRRGPMKVPTDATKVFASTAYAGTGASKTITNNFVNDLFLVKSRSGTTPFTWNSRLQGGGVYLDSSSTAAEGSVTASGFDSNTGVVINSIGTYYNSSSNNYVFEGMSRAPSFFDEVCYTGTGVARTVTHNLGVAPELMIVRNRPNSGGYNWTVYSSTIGPTKALYLNDTLGGQTYSGFWNDTAPTSSVFTVGIDGGVNANTSAIVAYLFATCPNVSKVGTYTGNGTTQTINCGFTSGARFVLIKRTNATGDWYVYDTARGMTTLTDPYLLMNSTAAESATLGSVTTVTTGFAVNSSILAAINLSGSTYTFLAIA